MPVETLKTFQYKLVLLGDSAVGKSSLVLRFVRNSFSEHQESTIGAAFLTQTMEVEGDTIKLEIWDTAGQERYHSLAPMYYRGAQAAVVVYDITSHESFDRAKSWIKELNRQASPNIIIALVGNKLDIEYKRQVLKADAESYSNDMNLIFFEASAKTGYNIPDIFGAISKKLPRNDSQHAARISAGRRGLNFESGSGTKGKCC